MKEVPVSIVIIAYNEEENIGKALDSLMRQSIRPEEIIVVDNNSKDSTGEIAKGYKGVRIVLEKKQGMSYARNRGLDEAKSEILVKLDADTLLDLDFIENLKKIYGEKEGIVGVSPYVYFNKKIFEIILNWRLASYITSIFMGHKYCPGPSYSLTKEAWRQIRENVCNDDSKVHEDVEISLHLDNIGRIAYTNACRASTSSRRIVETPYKFFIEQRIRLTRQYWLDRGLLKRFRIFWGHLSPYTK